MSSYLPSEASPVTETTPQSGQPRPSPVVLTRVSRVPLCRLLRCCQPEKGTKRLMTGCTLKTGTIQKPWFINKSIFFNELIAIIILTYQ